MNKTIFSVGLKRPRAIAAVITILAAVFTVAALFPVVYSESGKLESSLKPSSQIIVNAQHLKNLDSLIAMVQLLDLKNDGLKRALEKEKEAVKKKDFKQYVSAINSARWEYEKLDSLRRQQIAQFVINQPIPVLPDTAQRKMALLLSDTIRGGGACTVNCHNGSCATTCSGASCYCDALGNPHCECGGLLNSVWPPKRILACAFLSISLVAATWPRRKKRIKPFDGYPYENYVQNPKRRFLKEG